MTCNEVFQLAQDKGYYLFDPIRRSDYIELCMLQKHLRDEHNIDIEIENQYTDATYKCYSAKISAPSGEELTEHFNTYEKALLQAIYESLNLIK